MENHNNCRTRRIFSKRDFRKLNSTIYYSGLETGYDSTGKPGGIQKVQSF